MLSFWSFWVPWLSKKKKKDSHSLGWRNINWVICGSGLSYLFVYHLTRVNLSFLLGLTNGLHEHAALVQISAKHAQLEFISRRKFFFVNQVPKLSVSSHCHDPTMSWFFFFFLILCRSNILYGKNKKGCSFSLECELSPNKFWLHLVLLLLTYKLWWQNKNIQIDQNHYDIIFL